MRPSELWAELYPTVLRDIDSSDFRVVEMQRYSDHLQYTVHLGNLRREVVIIGNAPHDLIQYEIDKAKQCLLKMERRGHAFSD